MKINIWIEVAPWHLANDLKFKSDPYVSLSPFVFPCTPDIQRFKVEVEIPYKVEDFPTVKADAEAIQ